MHGLNMMRCSLSSIYCTYAYSWLPTRCKYLYEMTAPNMTAVHLQAMMAIWLLSKVD